MPVTSDESGQRLSRDGTPRVGGLPRKTCGPYRIAAGMPPSIPRRDDGIDHLVVSVVVVLLLYAVSYVVGTR